MIKLEFYNNKGVLVEKVIDKDAKIKGFTVTEYSFDLNKRIDNSNFEYISHDITKVDTLQKAVDLYKSKFNEYEKKSYDWKGYSLGCLKFYWENDTTDVMTYVKLNYMGNEVMNFDMNKLGFN